MPESVASLITDGEFDSDASDELTSIVTEGKKIFTYSTKYERDAKLRERTVQLHGGGVCCLRF